MSVTKFKFVSPGVFIDEIDNSQRPKPSDPIGPVIIGRSERGPTMRPVRINSFSDFIEVFGAPIGGQQGDDVWRQGNYVGPTYAAYAAQAWLRNTNAMTFVRLAGMEHSDATAAGNAGWATEQGAQEFGAYGLFLFPSGAADHAASAPTGTLAAVWYCQEGAVVLSGTMAGGTTQQVSGTNCLVQSSAANSEFKGLVVSGSSWDTVHAETTFNFDRTSARYIRNVFNTNPMLTNTRITDSEGLEKYWLGETYDRSVADLIHSVSSSGGDVYGFVAPLKAGTATPASRREGASAASSGWVISQDLTTNHATYQPANMAKLFRLHTLNFGDWEQQNLKVSVQNIKASTNDYDKYGSFDVLLRRKDDTDGTVKIVERFSGCTLNPYSSNYIGRKIGTQYLVWDDNERRYRTYGDHPNASKFVRVEVASSVEKGTADPLYLPFGFVGPDRYKDVALIATSGTIGSTDGEDVTAGSGDGITDLTDVDSLLASTDGTDSSQYAVKSNKVGSTLTDVLYAPSASYGPALAPTAAFTALIRYPEFALRKDSRDADLSSVKDCYFGVDSLRSGSTVISEESYEDYARIKGTGTESDKVETSFYFSLDDVKGDGPQDVGVYASGSRAAGTSLTAVSSSYKQVLDSGYDRWTMPLLGGFNGVDITEAEPFNEGVLANGTDLTNYAFYSLKRAIDTVADPEEVQYDLMCAPGVRHEGLTNHMIRVCEGRGDAMAIIDIDNAYTPRSESTAAASARGASVDQAVTDMQTRGLNTSYGATYFPWVQIRDTMTGQSVWAPPSIVALGAMSYGQKSQELWFAPAGFTRGGLTEGRGGLPVSQVSYRLTSKERDKLYEANINPIASFPNEGIVIFGQKTLQVTPSALDRINVRRLMIYVKREIAKMAATLLFDQNVTSTWNKFLSRVNPFLGSVKGRLGLMDFKVVLDSTTTTPDLIDRNIMYAKIFLKPAKAIEFIAIDFVITDSGAAFED